MVNKFRRMLENNKTRGIFIFSLFIITSTIAIIYNFVNYDRLVRIGNFEYWSIFLFAVYLLWTWKIIKGISTSKFVLKLASTLLIFCSIILLLTLPMVGIYIHSKYYNGIGIFVFMFAWIMEMHLFWTSEVSK